MAITPLGISLSTKYTLIGPDGTRVVFNEPSDADFVGAITEVTGLDSPEVRESAENLSGLDGGVHGNFYFGRRPITLSGTIYNVVSAEDRNKKITKLQQATAALRGDATLEWTPSGGEPVYVKVRRQQPLRVSGAWAKEFQVLLVAADPRVYSVATNEATTAFSESIGEVTAGVTPYYVEVSPDGKNVYVTEEASKKVFQFTRLENGQLEAMGTPSVEGTVNSGQMAISPNGKWMFTIPNVVGAEGGKEINIFERNTSTGALTFKKVVATVFKDAHDFAMSPDGTLLYVACKLASDMAEFKVAEEALTNIGGSGLGVEPEAVEVTPDGKFLLVLCAGGKKIVCYSKTTAGKLVLTGVHTYTTAETIASFVCSKDGKEVYVNFTGSALMGAIPRNVETGEWSAEFTPIYAMKNKAVSTSTLIVSPDGKNVYSANEKTIEQTVRDGEGRLTGLSPDGFIWPTPNNKLTSMSFSPDGKNLYIISRGVVFVLTRAISKGNLLYLYTPKIACINSGSFETFAVVTFKGQMEEPAVLNNSTGQMVLFEGLKMEPTDTLVVDMLNRTAILNTYTSKYGNVNFYATEWFPILPGENDLRASAILPNVTNASITIKWRNGWA